MTDPVPVKSNLIIYQYMNRNHEMVVSLTSYLEARSYIYIYINHRFQELQPSPSPQKSIYKPPIIQILPYPFINTKHQKLKKSTLLASICALQPFLSSQRRKTNKVTTVTFSFGFRNLDCQYFEGMFIFAEITVNIKTQRKKKSEMGSYRAQFSTWEEKHCILIRIVLLLFPCMEFRVCILNSPFSERIVYSLKPPMFTSTFLKCRNIHDLANGLPQTDLCIDPKSYHQQKDPLWALEYINALYSIHMRVVP